MNLAAEAGSEMIGREPCFYQIIYSVLDSPNEKPLLEYILRLILNTAQTNMTAVQNYLSGTLISKLYNILKVQSEAKTLIPAADSQSLLLTLQILRSLIT